VREPISRRSTAAGDARLTDREREVAMLVAAGLTSAEIGAELRIRPSTVDVHVRTIMQKLGVRKRAAIAAWATGQPSQIA
jgi:DNA-binding CsgD family transcriptional regulator